MFVEFIPIILIRWLVRSCFYPHNHRQLIKHQRTPNERRNLSNGDDVSIGGVGVVTIVAYWLTDGVPEMLSTIPWRRRFHGTDVYRKRVIRVAGSPSVSLSDAVLELWKFDSDDRWVATFWKITIARDYLLPFSKYSGLKMDKKAQLTLTNPRDANACKNCSNSTCFVSFHRIPFRRISNYRCIASRGMFRL